MLKNELQTLTKSQAKQIKKLEKALDQVDASKEKFLAQYDAWDLPIVEKIWVSSFPDFVRKVMSDARKPIMAQRKKILTRQQLYFQEIGFSFQDSRNYCFSRIGEVLEPERKEEMTIALDGFSNQEYIDRELAAEQAGHDVAREKELAHMEVLRKRHGKNWHKFR